MHRRLLSLVAVMLALLAGACDAAAVLERSAEARQLSTTLQAEFSRAVEASNRAVIADGDRASSDSAQDAARARERVARIEARLAALLGELRYTEEQKQLQDFQGKFAAYEALDAQILALAAEKTNVMATQLAFGAGRDAADAFEQALSGVRDSSDAKLRVLALEAILGVRELQALQPPHIAERDDGAMTRMEERMATLAARAREKLSQLSTLEGEPELRAASSALGHFMKINEEVVVLSRRNTNVRSLDLTLGQKRIVVATCDESLRAIHDALVARAQLPTR